jgi:hypothetical protein
MVLLQGIKKLFGPHLDDLDCISAVKVAMELQVVACMTEEDEVAAATHRHLQPGQGHPEGKEGLPGRWGLWDAHVYDGQQTSRNDFLANFLKSLIDAFIRFFGFNCRY